MAYPDSFPTMKKTPAVVGGLLRLVLVVAVVVLLLPLPATGQGDEVVPLLPDTHAECGSWAREGECRKNPGFMLDGCRQSCEGAMRGWNVEAHKCEEWAAEGECSRNPPFMQLHCSGTCGHGWAWSPWARQQMGLAGVPRRAADDDDAAGDSSTGNPSLDAALNLGGRLRLLLRGMTGTFALPDDSGNHFMEAVSVGELLLCAVNSAQVAVKGLSLGTDGAWEALRGTDAETLGSAVRAALADGPDRAHREARALFERFEPILAALAAYARREGPEVCAAGDALVRQASADKHRKKGGSAAAAALAPPDAARGLSGDRLQISLPPAAAAHTNLSGAKFTFSLLPHAPRADDKAAKVEMPMVGVGTCWLSPEQTYASVAAALDAGVRHVVSLLVGYEKGKEKM
jgi:hypothetical protein